MGRDVTPETIPANVARPHRPAQWGLALPGSDSGDNELLLIDLWLTLRSRKGLMLAVFLAPVLSAMALSFLVSPVYESRAVLEVGKVAGFGPTTIHAIEDPVVVLQRLREEHGLEGRHRPKELPYLDDIGHPRNSGQSLIVLTAHGRTPEETHAFLTQVTNPLLERHYELYGQARGAKEAQVIELEREIKTLEIQAAALASLIKEIDRGQAAIVTLERGNLFSALASLRAQRTTLILSLKAIESYPTRLIQEPTLAVNPVRPNPPLYLLLGVVLGVVLGIAIVLIIEFLARAREISRLRERHTAEQVSN